MNFIIKEAKKVGICLFIVDIIIIGITALAKILDISVVFGIIYGFVFTMLHFILLGTIVEKALSMDARRAKRHMQLNYIARMVLLGVILAIPFTIDSINGWCVIISILTPRITYWVIGIYSLIQTRKERD